jgi:hypothetical protein
LMGAARRQVAKGPLRITHPRVHGEDGNAACHHPMTGRENAMLAEALASMKPRQNGGAHWEETAVRMTQGLTKHKSPLGKWRRKKKFCSHSGRVRHVDRPNLVPPQHGWPSTRRLKFAYGPCIYQVRYDFECSTYTFIGFLSEGEARRHLQRVSCVQGTRCTNSDPVTH